MNKQNTKYRRPSETLSDREGRLVQLISEGGRSLFQCLLMAGYSRSVALSQGARIRRRPRVRKALIEERIQRGLFCSNQELATVGKSRECNKSLKSISAG